MERTPKRFACLLPVLLAAALCAGGCAVRREVVTLNPRPLVIHLPGVGGDNANTQWFLSALRTGGFDGQTRLFDWTSRSLWTTVLRQISRNRAVARALAVEVADFVADHPRRPVFLIAESGGAGPAVWLLEALPPNVQVQDVVLLSPALAPDYDLSVALARVRGRMIVFVSPRDTLVLGWGTRTFGTIDGKFVTAAGVRGFVMPPDAHCPAQYAKLQTVRYDPRWHGQYGNIGDHTGFIGTKFASGYLAPLLLQLTLDALAEPTTQSTTRPTTTQSTG